MDRVEKYAEKLKELRLLRYGDKPNLQKEKEVLKVMDEIWESMSVDDRSRFSKTNHLSWPPPRDGE